MKTSQPQLLFTFTRLGTKLPGSRFVKSHNPPLRMTLCLTDHWPCLPAGQDEALPCLMPLPPVAQMKIPGIQGMLIWQAQQGSTSLLTMMTGDACLQLGDARISPSTRI